MTTSAVIEWATAGAALAGQTESGDLHVVAVFPGGALVALVDGLGHGPEAALVARAAATLLTSHACEPAIALVQRCHEALKGTRGVVMTVVSLDARDSSLTWVGVGNVEGVLLRCDALPAAERIALRGGVVGLRLPPLRAEVLPLARGDTLVLVTDGIRSDFRTEVSVEQSPRAIADSILARSGKATDDALVVVARYVAPHRVDAPVRGDAILGPLS